MSQAATATARTPHTEGLLERFSYDDDIVRKFVFVTLLWAC
jgi:hypothetical protein